MYLVGILKNLSIFVGSRCTKLMMYLVADVEDSSQILQHKYFGRRDVRREEAESTRRDLNRCSLQEILFDDIAGRFTLVRKRQRKSWWFLAL